jgi:actin-like protein 6A
MKINFQVSLLVDICLFQILSPTKDGIVTDWDMVDNVWDHAFRNCLMIDPTEHPMLLAEPPLNSQQQREKSGFSTFYRC